MNSKLLIRHCVPCEGGVPPMGISEIKKMLIDVNGWEFLKKSDRIEKEFSFDSFTSSIKFVNKVAKLVESEGHHPNIEINFKKVKLILWTHAIGGLSENDFILAVKINDLTNN